MQLRDSVFKNLKKAEKLNLIASLDPKSYQDVYLENEIKTMRYWVAKDKKTLNVIGLTSIYTEIDDNFDECWIGWFCIDKSYRGLGFGKKLLEFSEEQARIFNR